MKTRGSTDVVAANGRDTPAGRGRTQRLAYVDTLKDQLTTVDGGCSPCTDEQFAVHK